MPLTGVTQLVNSREIAVYFWQKYLIISKGKHFKVGTELVFMSKKSGLVTLSGRQEVTSFILVLVQFNLLFV